MSPSEKRKLMSLASTSLHYRYSIGEYIDAVGPESNEGRMVRAHLEEFGLMRASYTSIRVIFDQVIEELAVQLFSDPENKIAERPTYDKARRIANVAMDVARDV